MERIPTARDIALVLGCILLCLVVGIAGGLVLSYLAMGALMKFLIWKTGDMEYVNLMVLYPIVAVIFVLIGPVVVSLIGIVIALTLEAIKKRRHSQGFPVVDTNGTSEGRDGGEKVEQAGAGSSSESSKTGTDPANTD